MIALDKVLNEGKIKVDDTDNTPTKYLKKHPECCSIYKVTEPNSSITYGFADVAIKYELTEHVKAMYKIAKDERYIRLSVCGFPITSSAFAVIELRYLNFLLYLLGH